MLRSFNPEMRSTEIIFHSVLLVKKDVVALAARLVLSQ
jgi:hypothetical protein